MEKRARTLDELSMLSNQALADYLLDYGFNSDSNIYVVASSMFSGGEPNHNQIVKAIEELGKITNKQAANLAIELDRRYPDLEAIQWIKANCKFAQQRVMLPDAKIEPILQMIAQQLEAIVNQDPNPVANYNAVKKQVTMALQGYLNKNNAMIPNIAERVDQIMAMMGMQQPPQNPPQLPPIG